MRYGSLVLVSFLAAVPRAHADVPRDEVAAPAAPTTRDLALSAGVTGGTYAALYGWLTLAWYVRTTDADHFQLHDEGWFGPETYAGGADKLGHAWGNYVLVRGVNRILRNGGWDRTTSIVASSALALSFFTLSEIKDGYKEEYGFSYGDMIMNAAGNALGVVLELSPALAERFDFRITYVPSGDYLRELERDGPFNTPEDYTGQTFFLVYKLRSNALVQDHAAWARYLDVALGYRATNYKPAPADGAARSQDLFVGLNLDVQTLVDDLRGHGVLSFVAGMYQLPYTTVRLGGMERERSPLEAP